MNLFYLKTVNKTRARNPVKHHFIRGNLLMQTCHTDSMGCRKFFASSDSSHPEGVSEPSQNHRRPTRKLRPASVFRTHSNTRKCTIECALKNQFWRARKVELVRSVPVPSKEMTLREQKEGETYHKWGRSKTAFWERFYGMFSPLLSFPHPFVFL